MSDLANIADPDQVLRHTASGRTLYCSERCLFCKIDKIIFADSVNQGRKRYVIFGEMQRVRTPVRHRRVYYSRLQFIENV